MDWRSRGNSLARSGTEPGADRGSQAGNPLGVVDATGSNAQPKMKKDSLTLEVECWHPVGTAVLHRISVENLILGKPSGESPRLVSPMAGKAGGAIVSNRIR